MMADTETLHNIESLLQAFTMSAPSKNSNEKCALVTGASSGMGKHLCQTLLDVNWTVIMVSRDLQKMKANIAETKKTNAVVFSADLSNPVETNNCCQEISKYLDEKCNSSLHLLVHAAGAGKPGLSIDKCSLNDWNWQMNLHVTALFVLTKCFTPYLAKVKGNVVNISSIVTETPFMDATCYAVSKGAVNTFTKCSALELAPHGIRVNCIAPGVIKTDFGVNMGFPKKNADEFVAASTNFNPLQRYGTCDDITQMVLFLADDEKSGFITGQIIKVDGGRSCVDIGSGYPIQSK
mmetsp:Transcript_28461/g.46737  ORF Transcript_28461/g.46737 Transcript_28461/m.46737 type:complete len:293 (+) Transcript_28461:11-889(+)